MANKLFIKIIQLRWYVLILFGLISLFGFYSLNKVKIDAIPDITNRQVVVNTKTFGMDPTKVEKSVTYPIEAELYGIPGLLEMRSISKFGLSQIILIFRDDIDIYFARNQVLQKISTIRDQIPNGMSPQIAPLTTGIGEIIIYRVYNPSTADDLMALRTIQQYQIARELKKVQGVAEVDTIGGFERELHLNVTPQKIAKYGMTPEKLIAQIQTIGENFGGGYIEQDDQQKVVRTFANINSFEDVMNIAVKIDYSGKELPLKHIVEVSPDYSQRLGSATYQGKGAVIGTIMMQSGENAKEVLVKVKQQIEKLNQRNKDIKIEILYDRQFLIDSTIKTVVKNLAEGILLVIGVLCLLLGNFKIGMIVASSLLFCILILAACMNLFGISANLMSLGAIDFGLLVDSSVVLIEYIVSTLILSKSKEEKIQSIAKLTAQVAKPIFIGISIIILVYVPILMFTGIEGKTFKPMAINVILAMIASLFVAFLLMPVLAYFFINNTIAHKKYRFFTIIQNGYERLLDKALANFRLVIFCCAGFFTFSLFLLLVMPSDFLPDLNEGDIIYTVVTKNGTSLTKTEEIIRYIEQKISANPSTNKEIEKTFSRIGTAQSGLDLMSQNSADIFVILHKEFKSDAKKISEKIYQKIKENCLDCEITQTQPIKMRFSEMLGGSRADLSLKIFGEDLNVLIDVTKKIKTLLEKKSEIKTIEEDFINSIRKGLFIDVEPNYTQIAKHQITISDVNNNLKNAMAGIQVGNFYATEFPISIVLHLSEKNREDINSIGKIPISLSDGGSFPLEKVALLHEDEDITSIPRLFGKRYSGISIYLKNTDYAQFIKNSEDEIIKNKILPEGYYFEWGGRFENFNSAKKQIFIVTPLIILIICCILYKMFGDVRKVLIVFSSVPFALSGAIFLLSVCQIPITISVYIGFIALIGIGLLNSIILIDTFKNNNDLKLACLSRLRPILMTAIVASLGFLPMAFGNGIGAEVQQPIAITIIGGIISSTIATLILSPVLIKKFTPA